MMSQKRCKGTLQDYKKGEISECQSKLWTNRNVFKMIATSEFLTALECTKFIFSRGSAPDPTEEAYIAPQTL